MIICVNWVGVNCVLIVQDTSTQFMCKTYFAREFHTLRMNFLKLNGNNNAKEEQQKKHEIHLAFVRSLSQSMKWEARGGKSGSKFCKTLGKSNEWHMWYYRL